MKSGIVIRLGASYHEAQVGSAKVDLSSGMQFRGRRGHVAPSVDKKTGRPILDRVTSQVVADMQRRGYFKKEA